MAAHALDKPIRHPLLRLVLASALAVVLGASLFGCSGIPKEPQVAATVNGTVIAEDEVTEYIEGFRSKNDSYGTDAGWAAFLANAGYTPSSFRMHIIETTFVPNELVRQECASRKIVVTDDQLDLVIEQEKSYYEQRYGEDSWGSVLASFGYDEQTWRENEELRLLEEQLTDVVVKDKKASKSDILRMARQSGSNYNGRHSYYIDFKTEKQAQAARDTLAKSADATVKPKAFKKLGDTVNAGWNSVTADRDKMSNEYLSALSELDARRVSAPVEDNGTWRLVLCDQVFTCPAELTYARLAAFPKKIYAQIESDASKAHVEDAYMDWLDEVTDSADIQVNAMPDGLPYAVVLDED